MRLLGKALLAVALAACVAPAMAQNGLYEGEKPWRISAGMFVPTDIPEGINSDLGFSIAVDRVLKQTEKTQILAGVRYSRYTWNIPAEGEFAEVNGDANLVHLMFEYRVFGGRENKFYVGPAVGLVFASSNQPIYGNDEGSKDSTDFAWSIGGGYQAEKLFFDVRYIDGGERAERGVILSVGGKF